MSAILKLLPLAAIGYFAYSNSDVIKKNLDVINNVTTDATSSIEMQEISRTVVAEYIDSNTIPLNNFSDFLEQNLREANGKKKRDPGKDMWGTPYKIERIPGGFQILCAAADKRWGTKDDIKVPTSLKQYGGVGEPGVTVVTPSNPSAQPQPATTPADTTAPSAAPPPPEPAPAPPPPPPEHKPYQWKRS